MDHITDVTMKRADHRISAFVHGRHHVGRWGRWAVRNTGLAAREDGCTSLKNKQYVNSRWREWTCGQGAGKTDAYVWASRATLFLFL